MTVVEALRGALRGHLSALSLDTVLQRHLAGRTSSASALATPEREAIAAQLELSVALFSGTSRAEIRRIVRRALELDGRVSGRETSARVSITSEVDVSVARSEARRIALEAGLSAAAAVKVATSVSELARNIVLYAGTGAIELEVTCSAGGALVRVCASDRGPGIDPLRLEAILSERYVSKTGLGKGIVAVRRIADRFEIESKPGTGTRILADFRGAS